MTEHLSTWVEIPKDSDFTIYNLPYGIFSTANHSPRAGVAIGEYIVDLFFVCEKGLLEGVINDSTVFNKAFLNDFISLGKDTWSKLRNKLIELLSDSNSKLFQLKSEALVAQKDATMHLPVQIGDYTDFYSSIEHATNVGKMFRDPENALLPNWKHIPVGYHGRSSSIVVSGTDIHRPKGQTKPNDSEVPIFSASRLLDFELEMAFVVGKSTKLGEAVSTKDAEGHIFGMVLFNDWSARDIQKWEYVPLGPFLGKNFGSSMSPWIVTLEALEPFRVDSPKQDPKVLPYLEYEGKKGFDISLEVYIKPENSEETKVCTSNFKYMYWNMAQQLAHHTVNGCNVNVGDVMASGTISGKEKHEFGSMLELSWGGKNTIPLKDGSERKFLQDNDTVIMKGHAQKEEIRVGFGEVRSKILPAK